MCVRVCACVCVRARAVGVVVVVVGTRTKLDIRFTIFILSFRSLFNGAIVVEIINRRICMTSEHGLDGRMR
jgi:hypothetical protein